MEHFFLGDGLHFSFFVSIHSLFQCLEFSFDRFIHKSGAHSFKSFNPRRRAS